MRLVRLDLENYRRHRRTTVEFQDGVTAIVGPNGAGKSTLLEAIAFALYGPKAAGTGKDLIRSEGAPPGDPVRVALELEVAGQAVRVVRELRGRAQAPVASLEVAGAVQVQPVAGSSEQATQAVERLLGLDREGFFHTVVARQRDLDRLGRLKPAERRAFVLDLVGIGAVDAALQRAREARAAARLRAEEAARHVGDAAALAARLAEAEGADRAAARAAREAEESHVRREAESLQAAARLEAARQAAEERAALARHADALAQAAAWLRADADRARAEEALAREAGERQEALRAQAAALDPVLEELATAQGLVLVRSRRSAQEGRIAQEEARLLRLRAEADAVQVPAPADLAALSAAAEAAQLALAAAQRDQAVAAERLARARRDAARLDVLDGAAPCPTCLQPVSGGHLEAERAAARARAQAAGDAVAAADLAARQAHAGLEAARAALAAGQAEARRREELARRREEAAQKAAGVAAALEALRHGLPPDPGPPADLDGLRRRAEEAQGARARLAVAEAAAARLPALRSTLLERERAAQAAAAEAAQARLRLAGLPDAGAALEAARRAMDAAQSALAQAAAARTQALLARQAAAAALQAAREAQERDQAARARLASLQAELARWTAVAGAAGGGLLERFREHLVARTAPAINQEASHLLAVFTQGRYTELVLDPAYEVWMGDGGVLHPLERFSGGEQDLAHLALRLGISRLLATRADAPEVRFLALDEVFSSLDQERCASLLAALRRLDGLYSQVLAVTHIERLQESFDGVVQVRLEAGESAVSLHNG